MKPWPKTHPELSNPILHFEDPFIPFQAWSHGSDTWLVGLAFQDRGPHPTQELAGDANAAAAFLPAERLHLEPHLLDTGFTADRHPGRLLQDPPQISGAGLGDVPFPLLAAAGEHFRMQTRVAGDGFAIGEAVEVADFGQNRGRDDQADSREGFARAPGVSAEAIRLEQVPQLDFGLRAICRSMSVNWSTHLPAVMAACRGATLLSKAFK